MNLRGAQAARYIARPDPAHAGLLLFGPDPMRVAIKRQDAVAALLGPNGESEMRLTRMPASDLRRDGAALSDALRAQGFFPGQRVVLLEDATDTAAPVIDAALSDWRAGDAYLVVTGGDLKKGALRTLFEGHRAAVAIALYDEPPKRDEIQAELARAGLSRIDPAALADLTALAQALDPGDFRQTLDKIALYMWGSDAALSAADVAACAPASVDTETDDLVAAAAEGRQTHIAPLIRRLEAQGVAPVAICIAATRHFRSLHAALIDPAGPESALGRIRNFRARDAMLRQARLWDTRRAEQALGHLVETDLTLRSSSRAPQMALVERMLLRLAALVRP